MSYRSCLGLRTTAEKSSVHKLQSIVKVIKLSKFVDTSMIPRQLSQIKWDHLELYGTSNFFSTIQLSPRQSQSEFARLIDVLLWYSDRSKLLLSGYEADHVLRLLWTTQKPPRFQFVNFSE
uniref:Uncharacterized protein n=1 Tax=Globisporangium ultimum (strain ATCC 200006 / CBS 805.95 / DAOM BR144) TaxID=431595 RepID=K3W595_GLOUD